MGWGEQVRGGREENRWEWGGRRTDGRGREGENRWGGREGREGWWAGVGGGQVEGQVRVGREEGGEQVGGEGGTVGWWDGGRE